MTLKDDISDAQKELDQAVRHLLSAPELFKAVSYNGMYQGYKTNLRNSKYLKRCRERVAVAKEKLRSLETKYYANGKA